MKQKFYAPAEVAEPVGQEAADAVALGRLEVTLCEPHSHNGAEMGPGDIVTLPAQIAEFLVSVGAAKHL